MWNGNGTLESGGCVDYMSVCSFKLKVKEE